MGNQFAKKPLVRKLLTGAFLVAAGSAFTLLVQKAVPVTGLHLYGNAFRTAYFDCKSARAHAEVLNNLPLEPALAQRIHKTEEADQMVCLDYRVLRYRLQDFNVTDAQLNLIEGEIDAGANDSLSDINPAFHYRSGSDWAALDRKLQKVIDLYDLRPLSIRRYEADPKWKLGQALFFDPVLSGNRDVSCATCHLLEYGLSDGLPRSIGTNGEGLGPERRLSKGIQVHPRHSLDLWNRDNNAVSAFFWDGHVEALSGAKRRFRSPLADHLPAGFQNAMAVQAVFPITVPDEMLGYFGERSSSTLPQPHANRINDLVMEQSFPNEVARIESVHKRILNRLLGINATAEPWQMEYRRMFKDAYPQKQTSQVNIVDVGNALAHFEELAFAAADSAWDRYLGGDPKAISEKAKVGALIFFGEGRCAACHSGPLFSDFQYHSAGIFSKIYKEDRYVNDLGRGDISHDPRDNYHFRTSPLRNVTKIGPYFHDGSSPTLKGAIIRHLHPLAKAGTYNPDGSFALEKDQVDSISPILRSGITLTEDEVESVLAFLTTLESQSRSREQIVPSSVPSGIPISYR